MNTLTYIWHDCFVYSNDSIAIVFDYWKDPFAPVKNNEARRTTGDKVMSSELKKTLERAQTVYVVVSHHHKDHYTRQIFDWCGFLPNVKYVLSKDVARYVRHILNPDSIYAGIRPNPDTVAVLKPGEEYHDVNLKIEAFDSTDIGNSYAVCIDGLNIFHAGDLNAWIWKDESTEHEVNEAIKNFTDILETIALKYPYFDLAMFPVDSRIGTDYFTGAKLFLEKIWVKHFFPMHFGLGESMEEQIKYQLDASEIKNYANPERGECICLQAPYSKFSMP